MSARGCRIFANGVLLRLILFRVASWCVSSIGEAGIKQKMHLFLSPLLQLVFLFEPFCFVSLQHVRTVKRSRTYAMPRHEAFIFMDIVHCPRAVATLLVASLQFLYQIALFAFAYVANCCLSMCELALSR